MRREFAYLLFIKNLISFSPRQLEGEQKAGNFIISFLEKFKFQYKLQYFWTEVPKVEKEILIADGKKIACKGTSFVSGKVRDKNYLISSLIPSRFFLDKSNINFNPKSPGISLSNFYFAPAIAVCRGDLNLILKAEKIEGEVRVKPVRYKARNILVGNLRNPKVICFAHYDSIGKGAVDNASGVAVLLSTLISHPFVLKENLFVFSANEELSYDKPTYWGHGFRAFEEEFLKTMKKTKKIVVVDCVGNGKAKILKDEEMIYLAFPIKNAKKLKNKISILTGDLEKLMSVYHSDLDNLKQISEKYLREAERKLLMLIKLG